MSTNKFFATSFTLTKLKHAITTAKSGQKCLVIPIDDNYLELITNEKVQRFICKQMFALNPKRTPTQTGVL